jgi:hypothetical protein
LSNIICDFVCSFAVTGKNALVNWSEVANSGCFSGSSQAMASESAFASLYNASLRSISARVVLLMQLSVTKSTVNIINRILVNFPNTDEFLHSLNTDFIAAAYLSTFVIDYDTRRS